MKKTILLPNNSIGVAIMLAILALLVFTPIATVCWIVSQFAPSYVALPFGLLSALVVLALTVKKK